MSNKFVTIAGFSNPVEAQLAVGRLDAEGIKGELTGDLSVSIFSGVSGVGGQVHLRVIAADEKRAIEILEECATEAHKDSYNSQTEDDFAIWVCPLCGDAVRVILPVCPSCHTLRGSTPEADEIDETAIQDAPSPVGKWRRKTRKKPSQEGIQKREEITVRPPSFQANEEEGEIEVPQLATLQGDEMARCALRTTLFGLVIPLFMIFSFLMVISLLVYDGELSPQGRRNLYITVAIHGIILALLCLLCAGLAS